jgi:hypothetical protein
MVTWVLSSGQLERAFVPGQPEARISFQNQNR